MNESRYFKDVELIEDWGLGFCAGTALRYLLHTRDKSAFSAQDDFRWALWFLRRAASTQERDKTEQGWCGIPPKDVLARFSVDEKLLPVLEAIYARDFHRAAKQLDTFVPEPPI